MDKYGHMFEFYSSQIRDTFDRAIDKMDAHRCNIWYINGLCDGRAIGIFDANALYTLNGQLGNEHGIFK